MAEKRAAKNKEQKKRKEKPTKEQENKPKAAAKKEAGKKESAKKEAKKQQKGSEEKMKRMQKEFAMDPYEIIKLVHMTEKSVKNIELQNSLVFIVRRKYGKNDIEKAITAAFGKDVKSVRTLVDQKGRKKAFVSFAEEGAAGDIAVRLGII